MVYIKQLNRNKNKVKRNKYIKFQLKFQRVGQSFIQS